MSSPPTTEPFLSLVALRAAHTVLLRRHRSEGETPEVIADADAFLARGRATGTLLAEDDERWTAQSLLDYWSTTLYRAGTAPPDATLDPFDPALAPALPDESCPFLGLDAFREENAALFFGRRQVVSDLLELLRANRLAAVVGPSGSGKSSLVRAGLIPLLRNNGMPGAHDWRILTFVPGSNPQHTLEQALAAAPTGDTPLLLLIDQFEETFTLCTDTSERDAFLSRLLALVNDAQIAHRAVLTMRSDFEPFVARAEALLPLFEAGKLVLPPLSAGELREAIERPAEQVGLKFEAGLVEALLQDILGEPAALPLLQFTLLRLWEERERNRVTLAIYKQVGGGRLALARSADALYESLIPEEQVTARRILLCMVRPGEGLEVTSNRVRRSDLDRGGEDPGRVARVLARLTAARLVRETPGDTPDDAQVEVAHEALVRNWPTLVEWLEEDRLSLRRRRRLTAAAEEWQRIDRSESALLRGVALAEAAAYDDLNELEQAFVTAGQAAERAEQQRAARTNQLIRALLVITSIASVVAIILAVQAFNEAAAAQSARSEAERQRATAVVAEAQAQSDAATAVAAQGLVTTAQAESDRQRRIVETQRLAFVARSQQQTNAEIGLLLAYESFARDVNPVTEQTLRDLIDAVQWRPTSLQGHEDELNGAAFSPDGSRIVTASIDGTARLWDSEGQLLAVLTGHMGEVNSAAFSPDGSRIVTASIDGTARLWDSEGQPFTVLQGHEAAVNSAAFSLDGSRILTASEDSTARLWDSEGQLLAVLQGHGWYVISAAFSPDGSRILTASADTTARLWDSEGQPLAVFTGHGAEVNSAAFSPDGATVLTASDDSTARLWDSEGRPLAVLTEHEGAVNGAVFSPDGSRILTASEDTTARLWDTSALLSAGFDGQPLATLQGHAGEVNGVVFSPDGSRILTAADDTTARLWDSEGQPLGVLTGHEGDLSSAVFNPDGSRILTASTDTTGRLWDSNRQSLAVLQGHAGAVRSAVYSPDGSRILTASDDGTARLWDTDSQAFAVLQGHEFGVASAVFSPDGSRILTASDDGTARLWDTSAVLSADASEQPLATLQGHAGSVRSAVFSPDGSRILTASDDGTARLWDSEGRPLAVLTGHESGVTSAVFSPDGSRILTASDDGTARLWDTDSQALAVLQGHAGSVKSAVFSPDGSRILTASDDGTAHLWDSEGQPFAVLTGHEFDFTSAAFSPEGSRILTASDDGTARQYLVRGEDLLRAAACRVGRGLTEVDIVRFQVPTPLAFDFGNRQCPPVYSWEQE